MRGGGSGCFCPCGGRRTFGVEPYRIYHVYPSHEEPQSCPDSDDLPEFAPPDCYVSEVRDELRRLFNQYGEISFGARHQAPCAAWRAERLLIDNGVLYSRFANRVHIFQKRRGLGSDQYMAGRYLGYVTVRPYHIKIKEAAPNSSEFRYTTVANIAPPHRMLRPRYHIITTVGGPPDGVKPLRCAPFCVPHPATDYRASCLHAAVHQAVLLKAHSFDITPISSQDVMTLLWEKRCKSSKGGKGALRVLYRKGTTLEEALEVLQDPRVGGGGITEAIKREDFDNRDQARRETVRCLTDYLANGLPVVVSWRVPLKNGKSAKHAFLLLGLHLLQDPEEIQIVGSRTPSLEEAELPGRFVCHDYTGPYTEIPTAKLLSRIWLRSRKDSGLSGTGYLAIAPRDTKLGIYDVRRTARALVRREPLVFFDEYRRKLRKSCNTSRESEHGLQYRDLRMVTRLLQTSQLELRYGPSEAFRRKIGRKETYWWCVEVRVGRCEDGETSPGGSSASTQGACEQVPPAIVYMWEITQEPGAGPKAILQYEEGRP